MSKIQQQTIFLEVIPTIQKVSQLQEQRIVFLPFKVSFALSKNMTFANSLRKTFDAWQKKLILETVALDEKGTPKIIDTPAQNGQPPSQKWDFISPEHEKQFLETSQAEMEREVEFQGHKISSDEIEKVDNLPVAYLSKFDEWGFISELKILK